MQTQTDAVPEQVGEDGQHIARQGVMRRFLGWFWGQRDSAEKGEPVKRTAMALVLLALGVLGSEAYQWTRGQMTGPDEYLVKLQESQDRAFEELKGSLNSLGGSLDGSQREALSQVRGAVEEIKAANTGLVQQLALARQENDRLSRVALQQAGVAGGYDFILTEHTSMPVDEASVVGVTRISANGAQVNVSSREGAGRDFLSSGESLVYRNATGKDCKVTLLSIGGNGRSASFANSCVG